MAEPVAIVTGGLRGLGRAMSLGLARTGHPVVAVGHIAGDAGEMAAEAAALQLRDLLVPLIADLRRPDECDRVVAAARARFGRVDILVNNAGLTFTYIDPARFRSDSKQLFFQVGDEIVENVVATNYLAADRMARRVAPAMVEAGWGRIVNVTTKLDTMNRTGTHPYGATTPGMAEEMRQASREGKVPRLVEPDEMVPPLLYVVSREADAVNGYRFDANAWDVRLPAAEAAKKAGRPAGFILHPQAEG